jgi:hypothetical protein
VAYAPHLRIRLRAVDVVEAEARLREGKALRIFGKTI